MQLLNPSNSLAGKAAVHAIASQIKAQNSAISDYLSRRLSQLYGDLGGQRAVSADVIANYTGTRDILTSHDLVMGLETLFSAICHIVSAAALSENRERFLNDLISSPNAQFAKQIVLILNGSFQSERGFKSFADRFEDQLLNEASIESLSSHFKVIVSLVLAETENGQFDTLDPMQSLHNAIFPSNLCHVTGQFYTPPWLARLVLDSVAWKPGEKLIDPFCGSGVFLLMAIEKAAESGIPIDEVAPSLIGFDLSPSAVCASKTNLLLAYTRHNGRSGSELPINILCADSLAPTISRGQGQGQGLFAEKTFFVNGESISQSEAPTSESVAACLSGVGMDLSRWGLPKSRDNEPKAWSRYDRETSEQIAAYKIQSSDVVVTNPPWVGWEYISKTYREQLAPAWGVYDLFEQKGLKAAFLKEDLSTLCVPAAMDAYLADGGRAGLVLRQSTMKSDLAGRGVRRLSIYKGQDPLELTRIHDLGKLNVFEGAAAPASIWILNKGKPTQFPVPVSSWSSTVSRSVPVHSKLSDVISSILITEQYCRPVSNADPQGRWTFDGSSKGDPLDVIKGANAFKPRIGFFTGGANAVYYLVGKKDLPSGYSTFTNITERAKREAPKVSVQIENDLVYSVIRGRDVSYWKAESEVFVLCPHNEFTKIKPIEHSVMTSDFPKAMQYLEEMRYLLDQRNGFSGWEKKTQEEYFYAIQRIGDYSFAPYKVCWSYISEDFVVAVCGKDPHDKPILPNDKVVFIPAQTSVEAFFIAGLLSFNVIRSSVISSVTSRQVSASVIRPYVLPQFDPNDDLHYDISKLCRAGHSAVSTGDFDSAEKIYSDLNAACGKLMGVPVALIDEAERMLVDRLGYYPFKLNKKNRSPVTAIVKN